MHREGTSPWLTLCNLWNGGQDEVVGLGKHSFNAFRFFVL